MHKVAPRDRRSIVMCFKHNKQLAVQTDTQVITKFAVAQYPSGSAQVLSAFCRSCSRSGGPTWYLSVAKLRAIKRQDPRREKPIDIRLVTPDSHLELLRDLGLIS